MRGLFKTKQVKTRNDERKQDHPETDWRDKKGKMTHTEYWLGPKVPYRKEDLDEEMDYGNEDYRIIAATEDEDERETDYDTKEDFNRTYRMVNTPQRRLEKSIVNILVNYGQNHLKENQVLSMNKKVEYRYGGGRTEIQKFKLETTNKRKE
uniref:p18 n=1 Tax=Little cherry virus 2 TaxID=154339 RepID=A0A7D0NMI0_9CLOS|nr:p18 [Little cherry virus 2]